MFGGRGEEGLGSDVSKKSKKSKTFPGKDWSLQSDSILGQLNRKKEKPFF
jgi:hypothetical protein